MRPDVVEATFALTTGDIAIKAYGMRSDMKMKIFEWTGTTLLIPQSVGRSTRLGAWVQRRLDYSEAIANSLAGAIKGLYPRDGAGKKNPLGSTADRAERAYWTRLEDGYRQLVEEASRRVESDLDSTEIMEQSSKPWNDLVASAAREAFDSASRDLDVDSNALERLTRSRGRLEAAIWRRK